ncbi:hypothetical protein GCM10022415_11510 [Knoellia locipacati]|uniref:Uncharacterized protein n=1 Tax=Knoellia locipacati TaxID=882824 RepID=A0A512SYT9_9MICO|nr:hypothetical protein [Knoellia locipacati]GEQ13102.1 hypothetical protein KLO01_11490 [Knoellia locipacati]
MTELRSRSWVLSGWAALLGAAAGTLVTAYLHPARNDTWLNLAIAAVVLLSPLLARPPWTRLRLVVCAGVWLVVGLPGSYVFGVPVFLAGALLGIGVGVSLVRQLLVTPASV